MQINLVLKCIAGTLGFFGCKTTETPEDQKLVLFFVPGIFFANFFGNFPTTFENARERREAATHRDAEEAREVSEEIARRKAEEIAEDLMYSHGVETLFYPSRESAFTLDEDLTKYNGKHTHRNAEVRTCGEVNND